MNKESQKDATAEKGEEETQEEPIVETTKEMSDQKIPSLTSKVGTSHHALIPYSIMSKKK